MRLLLNPVKHNPSNHVFPLSACLDKDSCLLEAGYGSSLLHQLRPLHEPRHCQTILENPSCDLLFGLLY